VRRARGAAAWPTLAALFALLAVLAVRPAWADPPGRVGRLAETQGTVWIYDAGRGGWDEALRNRPVTGGDRIATDQGSRAVIQVGSATLRLGCACSPAASRCACSAPTSCTSSSC
jgi:hypothetical protein